MLSMKYRHGLNKTGDYLIEFHHKNYPENPWETWWKYKTEALRDECLTILETLKGTSRLFVFRKAEIKRKKKSK